MTDKNESTTPPGAEFSRLLAASSYSGPKFGEACGIEKNPGQVVQNWKARGVPTKLSTVAAAILGCDPHEISAVASISSESTESEIVKSEKIKTRDELELLMSMPTAQNANAIKKLRELISFHRRYLEDTP